MDLPRLGHGMCYLWDPTLVLGHVVTDLVTAGAYFIVGPLFLYLSRVNRAMRTIRALIGAFIILCGLVHLMSAAIVFWPYWEAALLLKLAMAVVSAATAIAALMHWGSVRYGMT